MTTEHVEEQSSFTDLAENSPKEPATLEITSLNKSPIFTKEECAKLIESCIEELWLPVSVVGTSNFHASKRQKVRGDVNGFPFIEIRSVTKEANDSIYDFSLLGIIDQDFPQVYKYSEGDFYNMHSDLTPVASSRKLTFIINLNDPSEYEGGEFEFLNMNTSEANLCEQGHCLIFPAYLPYKINKITKGSKHILVGHVHGTLFK